MNVLSSASAFNPGSDLWILPDFSCSRWTRRIDWHLNFQIIRACRRPSPEPREFITLIQKETELEVFNPVQLPNAPLLISSVSFFPNRWVVVIPNADFFEAWVRQSSDIWEALKHPTLRIFLPTGQSSSSFHNEWSNRHATEDFTLVLD